MYKAIQGVDTAREDSEENDSEYVRSSKTSQ
jgi:hypothetical protein